MAQLEKSLDKIRNILRSEGITGMDSVNHCIIYMFSRLLDTRTCKKIGIDKSFAFKNIRKHSNGEEIGREEFICKIYNGNNKDTFYYMLHVKIGFNEMRYKQKDAYNLEQIYDELEKINVKDLSTKFDMIGTIYELHLRSGTSNSMRDLGQYYTHRLVIKYMVELCKPKVKDGLIDRIIDPTMGTGGFLTMATKFLNNKYDDIDWNINKERIVGFDIDAHVKNMALLNLLLEIHYLPDKTLKLRNTLQKDLDCEGIEEYDVILANEPMGLKNIKYKDCSDKIKDLKIKGNKAEPLFLHSFMQHLAKKGRCAVIIPDGVLFNESSLHKKTREYLIENFNLKKVVTLNDDKFFINTGVKTSILFFKNTGKTKEVEFSEIKIKDDDINETSIIKVKYDTIVKENYILFVNRYTVEEVEKIEGIEYKKLRDICEFLSPSKRKASFGKEEGEYNFYTSSSKIKKCDMNDYKEECIIIGNGGNANIKFGKNFSCSSHNFIINSNKDSVKSQYIYYYLNNNIDIIENGFKGSTIKNISKSYLENIEIPIPSLEKQNEIVENLDLLECDNEYSEKKIEITKNIMKNYIKINTKRDIEVKEIGEICELCNGKNITKKELKEGEIPVVGGGKNPLGFHNKYNINENTIIISKDGAYAGYISRYNTKVFVSNHGIYAKKISKNILESYIYYVLKILYQEKIYKLQTGSAQPGINKKYVEKINISIPSLEKQKEIVEQCDFYITLINNMERMIEMNKVLMKQNLEFLSHNEKETNKVTKKNNEVII